MKSNAFQERKAKKVDVRQQASHGKKVGQRRKATQAQKEVTCGGDCCTSFRIVGGVRGMGDSREDRQIKEMIIPLGKGHYTCKNFNTKTRLCMIYDSRPQMCRTFPRPDDPCSWCGLTKTSDQK